MGGREGSEDSHLGNRCKDDAYFSCVSGLGGSRIRVRKIREGILNMMIPLTLPRADPRGGVSTKPGTEDTAGGHRATRFSGARRQAVIAAPMARFI